MKILLAVIVFASVGAMAEDLTMKGRSGLELDLGIWGGSKVSSSVAGTGVWTEANATAFLGGLTYRNFLRGNLSLTVSAGLLAAGVSSSAGTQGVSSQTSSVVKGP